MGWGGEGGGGGSEEGVSGDGVLPVETMKDVSRRHTCGRKRKEGRPRRPHLETDEH